MTKRTLSSSKLDDIVAEHVAKLTPLAEQQNSRNDFPQMVNFVSTVEMLPPGGQYRYVCVMALRANYVATQKIQMKSIYICAER